MDPEDLHFDNERLNPNSDDDGQTPPPGSLGRESVELMTDMAVQLDVTVSSLCYSRAVEIQRLVTPLTLQRKRAKIAEKKRRIAKAKTEAAEYQKLLASRLKEQREKRSESLAKIRSRLSAASKPSIVA
ncbi:hypothetical protein RHGRI_026303 [Rhododendron griersonianum]|uniref:40S ribosomal protein S6-2 n=1 Tax=Rhododendron griersonianum TaxID=479676 RepID=A0AAV6IX91_9ERIC|nr:hypothetical protein RHGRI_026303 [Rhododendron griersonianum]